MKDKKQQVELDVEQWTNFKLVKEYIKAAYCPCLFNLQSTSFETLGWMSQALVSWNQDFQEKY